MPFTFDAGLITMTFLGVVTSRELGGFAGGFIINLQTIAVCGVLSWWFR